VTMLLLALSLGFLLGILVMVLLVSGRDGDEMLERIEEQEKLASVPPAAPRGAGPRPKS